MSQEMTKAINDGLLNYEDELWDPSDDEAWVSTDKYFEEDCPVELNKYNILPLIFIGRSLFF